MSFLLFERVGIGLTRLKRILAWIYSGTLMCDYSPCRLDSFNWQCRNIFQGPRQIRWAKSGLTESNEFMSSKLKIITITFNHRIHSSSDSDCVCCKCLHIFHIIPSSFTVQCISSWRVSMLRTFCLSISFLFFQNKIILVSILFGFTFVSTLFSCLRFFSLLFLFLFHILLTNPMKTEKSLKSETNSAFFNQKMLICNNLMFLVVLCVCVCVDCRSITDLRSLL